MKWNTVKSSNLKALSYYEGDLYVEFLSGKKYRYWNVGYETYNTLVESESIGKAYISNIKNKFSFEEIQHDTY